MDLRISQLPFVTSGAPNSILAIVDYNSAVTGVTSAIYFSSVTANLSGATGTSGTNGSSGVNGTSGTNGSSGVNGTSGTNGSSGINGTSGTNGTSGRNGTSGTSPQRLWGAFISTDDQYVASTTTAYSMSANTTTGSNGVTLSANTRFVVSSAGTYNLQFSAQLESTGGGSAQTMDIWLAKNGSNVSNSNTQVVVNSNNGKSVAAWNFVEELEANGYLELKFRVDDTRLGLQYDGGPFTSPTRPAIPSLIVTVTQV